jgi:hypothetical protein
MEEREFLHNLINPLAIGLGNIKLLHRRMTTNPAEVTHEKIVTTLQTALDAFARMNVMVEERRNYLRQSSEPNPEAQPEKKET